LCNFDEEGTSDGWDCLANYAYKVDEDTGNFSKEPAHDTEWSHGADAYQTLALSIKSETASKKKIVRPDFARPIQGATGWMG
jgi:phage terminase large subunit